MKYMFLGLDQNVQSPLYDGMKKRMAVDLKQRLLIYLEY